MLPRVLEPEVMESEAEARDYDTMDHSVVNRAFASDFLSLARIAGPILDVGRAGTAQIPVELCRQDPTLRIVAVDASAAMLRLAQANIDRAGFADRIRALLVDAKRLPYPDGAFAAVVSNSIVHHIPEPRSVLVEMVRVTQTDGRIFVRDLLRPEDDAAARRIVELHAAGANREQCDLFEASLRAALTVDEMKSLIAELGFDPATVRQTTDRHWTWSTPAHEPQGARRGTDLSPQSHRGHRAPPRRMEVTKGRMRKAGRQETESGPNIRKYFSWIPPFLPSSLCL